MVDQVNNIADSKYARKRRELFKLVKDLRAMGCACILAILMHTYIRLQRRQYYWRAAPSSHRSTVRYGHVSLCILFIHHRTSGKEFLG